MAEKNLSVKLSLNDKQFQSSLKKATRSLKKFGASMQRTGQTMTRSLTLPVIAFGAVAIKAFDEQIKAETKLRTSLKGNEEAFKNLKNQAQELQKVTLFGDEATMEAQGFLAQLGLNEEAILRLTPLIQDFATAQGVGLGDAAKLVAKSVGSSTNALSRYGIQIEGEVGTVERLNSAVNALSTAFGGQAEAVSKEGLGPLVQMQNRLGDIAEEIGEKLIPIIIRLGEKLMSFLNGFSNLDSKTQEIIIGIALLTATLGPLLIVLGSIAVAIAGISAPVLATVAAVTALAAAIVFITDNWEALKERFSDISWWKNAIISILQFFVKYNPFNAIVIAFNKLRTLIGKDPIQNPFDLIKDGLEDLKVETKEYENEFNDFGTSIKNSLEKVLPLINKFNKGIGLGSGGGKKETFTPLESKGTKKTDLPATLEKVEMPDDLDNSIISLMDLVMELNISLEKMGETLGNVLMAGADSFASFAESAKSAAKSAIGALIAEGVASAVSMALKNPVFALNPALIPVVAGLAGGLAKTAFNSLIPAFADGGLVTGSTIGMVGEGPGTSMSNPEVIAPLDKLKGIIGDSGGGNVQVFGTIKGSDILLSSDRAKNNRNRTRGY
jgi:hypothetical protein